jgi:hypothetical protein
MKAFSDLARATAWVFDFLGAYFSGEIHAIMLSVNQVGLKRGNFP